MLSRTKESPTNMFNLSSGDQGGSHLPGKQWCDNKLIISKTTPGSLEHLLDGHFECRPLMILKSMNHQLNWVTRLIYHSMILFYANIMNDNYSLKHGSSALKQWRKSTTFIRFALQAQMIRCFNENAHCWCTNRLVSIAFSLITRILLRYTPEKDGWNTKLSFWNGPF